MKSNLLIAMFAGAVVAFGAAFALQAHVIGLFENLTASDSTGELMIDGRLTAHGWLGLSWRAGTAGIVGGLLGLVACKLWSHLRQAKA